MQNTSCLLRHKTNTEKFRLPISTCHFLKSTDSQDVLSKLYLLRLLKKIAVKRLISMETTPMPRASDAPTGALNLKTLEDFFEVALSK